MSHDSDTAMVETSGPTKRYRYGVFAVGDLDLRVGRGEVYGFLGLNGAGKTTTLRMLIGLIRPSVGSACVAGYPAGHPDGLIRTGCPVEAPYFYPYLLGWDNLRVVARCGRLPTARIDAVLAEVDLLGRAGDRYATYSTGMRQRLGVAAALLKDPELLILDEPTNGLDPQGVTAMHELIRALGEGGRHLPALQPPAGRGPAGLRSRRHNPCRLVAQAAVAELRASDGLVISAEPAYEAGVTLRRVLTPEAVSAVGDSFHLAIDRSLAADLVDELVARRIRVSEVRPLDRSLAEVFLDPIGTEAAR